MRESKRKAPTQQAMVLEHHDPVKVKEHLTQPFYRRRMSEISISPFADFCKSDSATGPCQVNIGQYNQGSVKP